MVDEIYLGLSYDERYARTVLALAACGDDVVSVNSFSKYFGMTGWRLGWLVLPEALVAPVERLAQNLYICPSTVAQHAALACFSDESIAEFERRRAEFRRRRDYMVDALQRLGMAVPVAPDGAFYAWADCSRAQREQLGLLLRSDAPRTGGADARARLRALRPRALPAAVVRQLDGRAPGGGGAPAAQPVTDCHRRCTRG